MSNIDEIRARLEACPIPEDAQADWAGTNHYEITSAGDEGYWWLVPLWDTILNDRLDSNCEVGQRLGAVLDYACAYRRDVGELLRQLDTIRTQIETEEADRAWNNE